MGLQRMHPMPLVLYFRSQFGRLCMVSKIRISHHFQCDSVAEAARQDNGGNTNASEISNQSERARLEL